MRTNVATGSRLLVLAVLAVACGNRAEPAATPSAAAPGGASAEPAASSPSSPSSPAEHADPSDPPPPPKRKRPLEIHNACGNVMTVVFGEDPNAKGAGTRTIAGNSSVDGPRDDQGNMTIHLLDEKSQPIVKVHVTRGMKRVEIGASCRTLDAR